MKILRLPLQITSLHHHFTQPTQLLINQNPTHTNNSPSNLTSSTTATTSSATINSSITSSPIQTAVTSTPPTSATLVKFYKSIIFFCFFLLFLLIFANVNCTRKIYVSNWSINVIELVDLIYELFVLL